MSDFWRHIEAGDVWDYAVPSSPKPVAYKVRDGWMVAGIRTVAELRQIADMIETAPGKAKP